MGDGGACVVCLFVVGLVWSVLCVVVVVRVRVAGAAPPLLWLRGGFLEARGSEQCQTSCTSPPLPPAWHHSPSLRDHPLTLTRPPPDPPACPTRSRLHQHLPQPERRGAGCSRRRARQRPAAGAGLRAGPSGGGAVRGVAAVGAAVPRQAGAGGHGGAGARCHPGVFITFAPLLSYLPACMALCVL